MLNISTEYDKKVGKVFVVRGEEGYAKTTDTTFDIITDNTSNNSIEGYKVGFKYNVLRDVGSSKIVLYDDDTALAEFDWDSDDSETYVGVLSDHTTIDPSTCVYLTYGVEHNLFMRYKGNTNCMKSRSRTVKVYEPIPQEFKSSIEFSDITISNHTINLDLVLLVNNQETSATHNQSIEVFVDDVSYGLFKTGANSNHAIATLEDIEYGSHNITVNLMANESINDAINSTEVSVGYSVEILKYPYPFITGTRNIVRVQVSDMLGEPVVGEEVVFGSYSADTDDEGIATLDVRSITSDTYRAYCNGYSSDSIDVVSYDPSLSLIFDDGYTTKATSEPITASLSEPYSGIPIIVSMKKGNVTLSNERINTDNNGNVRTSYTGSYRGKITVKAEVLNTYRSASSYIEDCYIYCPPSPNLQYGMDNLITDSLVNLSRDATGLKVSLKDNNTPNFRLSPMSTLSDPCEFSFEVSSCPYVSKLKIVTNNQTLSTDNYISYDITRGDLITIYWNGSYIQLKVNGQLVRSASSEFTPRVYFGLNSKTVSANTNVLTLKNLKQIKV